MSAISIRPCLRTDIWVNIRSRMKTIRDTQTTPATFLTAAELAARWKVTPMTLRRWRNAGKIKASFLGRGVRIPVSEVERFEREAQA